MSYSIKQPTDGTLMISNPSDAVADLHIGGPTSPTATAPRLIGQRVAKMALGALDTGGGVLSWQNSADYPIIIDRIVLDVTTIATSACSVSAGTTVSSATTSSANLIDTLDIHSAIGIFDNITDKGSGGKSKQKLASLGWVTVSMASGAAAGTKGYAYISYYPATT